VNEIIKIIIKKSLITRKVAKEVWKIRCHDCSGYFHCS